MTSKQPSRARQAARAAATITLVIFAVLVMIGLSLWQWERARATGRFLNYSYAGEWLLFAVLTVIGAIRLAHEGRLPAGAPATPSDTVTADPEPVPVPRADPATRADLPAIRPMIGPPLAPGEELEEVTWVRIRRRIGLDRQV